MAAPSSHRDVNPQAAATAANLLAGTSPSPDPAFTAAAYRVQQMQAGTVYAMWEQDGQLVNPGTVTVTIVNDAGVTLVSGAATSTDASGMVRSYKLAPPLTAALDILTVIWTSGADGTQITTYVEIVGGFMFSVAQAQTRSPLQDSSTYPPAAIMFYRTLAEQALEDACGVSFVPRYRRDVCRITGFGLLKPPRREITAVRNVYTQTDNGPVALSTLRGLRIENTNQVWVPGMLNWWSMPVTMAYECGYAACSLRVGRAALELARRWIVESPWDERTTSFRTRDGGQMTILTANHTDMFDLPEVVAVVDAYSFPMIA